MKKICRVSICTALLVNTIPLTTKANQYGGNVNVSVEENVVRIGNEYIQRVFQKENNQWKTKMIENKRIHKQFQPAPGSEDFVIQLKQDKESEKPNVVNPSKALARDSWEATLKNNQGTIYNNVDVLFDGDPNTHVNEFDKAGMPISLEIDLKTKQQVSSFSFLKRPGYHDPKYGINGTMGDFKLYVSDNGSNWEEAGVGSFTKEDYNLHEEDGLYNVGVPVYANFDKTYTTRYVKIEVFSDVLGGTQEFSGAEIQIYQDRVQTGMPVQEILLSDKEITFQNQPTTQLTNGSYDDFVSGSIHDEIIIDLKSQQHVSSFGYQKRPGALVTTDARNGTLGKYELFVSDDKQTWTPAGEGEFIEEDYNLHPTIQENNILYNVGDMVYGNFDKTYQTRYVKIVPKSDCLGNTDEFHISEIRLFSDRKFEEKEHDSDIRSSELRVLENGITTTENEVRVSFDTYEKDGIQWDIDMVTVMEDHKHYMNTYLEITSDQPDKGAIDYIDFDRFIIPESTEGIWSIPDESEISSMWIGKHELMLGQPIYADGLFFGSEFPVQESDIENENVMKMRYYSGKTIAKMKEDQQNVSEDGKTFTTWNNVVGAAQGIVKDVVQTDFFDYIEDIATPTQFRKQYNSWYDNMMNISDESIERSFLGAEKGLAENGVEPLDSYVVDDGWNNYNNDIGGVYAPGESGTTKNKTGFWEFNSKFPNELYTSTELTNKFQSSFGLWVGPQGGYNFYSGFGKYLEAMGTGEMQSNSALGNVVCTGSRTYLKNFEQRFIDYQERFDIDYWKWDGFASRPCDNSNHNHMVGGNHNMYYTSDMWEGWTKLIERARAQRIAQGKQLWINATCYVNLSPWLLQWVNSIWVQDSGDTGEAGDTAAARHLRKIYYRDNVYYNLYKQNQIQFPLKNIYNHDPIYGVSDSSNATTDEFREFLFANAMRGTAFWELYYSPSIMDKEKWQATTDAMQFAETYHEVLKNAKLFVQDGKNPTNGIYGYSAWSKDQGFVSFVNPTNTKQTYRLKLDNVVGVPTTMSQLQEYQIFPYTMSHSSKQVSYNDILEITLEPFSSQIYQYGNSDQEAPKLVSAKILDDATVEVKFNERVTNQMQFKVNHKHADATLLADYRTFHVHADTSSKEALLEIENIVDGYGNFANNIHQTVQTAQEIVTFPKNEDSTNLTNVDHKTTPFSINNEKIELTNQGIKGTADFSISFGVQTKDSNVILLQQTDDFSIQIDEEGYISVTIKGDTFTSKEEIRTVVQPATGRFGSTEYQESQIETSWKGKINDGKLHSVQVVRELNGVLKIYVDGFLSSSFYNKEDKNKELLGNPVTLGDENFIGYISNLSICNQAIYYDDAKQYADDLNINLTAKNLDKSNWIAEACTQESDQIGADGAAAGVLDNDPSTFWHSSYSKPDHHEGPHTLQIQFDQPTTFDNIEYIGRPQGSQANGAWKSAKVYGIHKKGEETVLLAEISEIPTDQNHYTFAFPQSQSFDGIKFEVTGKGGFAAAAEIHVSVNVKEIDASDVLETKKQANNIYQSINKEEFTQQSYQTLSFAYEQVMQLEADVSEDTLHAVFTQFQAAYKALEKLQKVDKSSLYQVLKKYENYRQIDYTLQTWDKFSNAYQKAKDLYNNPNATQEEVDQMIIELCDAAKQLIKLETNENEIEIGQMEVTSAPQEIQTIPSPNTADSTNRTFVQGLFIVSFGILVSLLKRRWSDSRG